MLGSGMINPQRFESSLCTKLSSLKNKTSYNGGLAEWSIAAVLKTVVPARAPGVRIPHPPPNIQISKKFVIFNKVLLCVCLF